MDAPNLHKLHKLCSSQAKLARVLEKETGYAIDRSTLSRMLSGEAKPLSLALVDYACGNVLRKLGTA